MKRALIAVAVVLLAAPARAQDFSGAWDVTGTDPALGAYSGQATVVKSGAMYEVSRLVEVATPLPDGRTLVLSWRGTAHDESGGLRMDFALRQQDFISKAAGLVRGPQHVQPLALSVRLDPPAPLTTVPIGAKISGTFQGGPFETWTRVQRVPVGSPALEVRLDPRQSAAWLTKLCFLLFKHDYFTLPEVAPYVQRPEFQACIHFQAVDTTGKVWTRGHPNTLLVVQKVPDAIALIEEDLRASAFRWMLVEKATRADQMMIQDHVEASTGMLGGYDTASKTRSVHGDSGLHQGVWVASQMYRFQATQDPVALANVELGTKALISMVDAPGTPTEFARAVQSSTTAPQSGWQPSPSLPGISYIPGGNNDMLHGVDLGFVAAERALPAGHPLLAEIGKRAKSLVENHKLAKKGLHELFFLGVAARITGDPGMQSRYHKRLVWNPLERFWLKEGEGVGLFLEFDGRSGSHLACTTFAAMSMLGGANPDSYEKSWRADGASGTLKGWNRAKVFRPGLHAVIAAAAGDPAAGQIAKDVLAELPWPRPTGDAEIDFRIDPKWCPSPWPAMPYKRDYMRDPGRRQSLVTYPLWTIGESDNYWKEGPSDSVTGGLHSMRWSPQDYLLAYWSGRAQGVIGAND